MTLNNQTYDKGNSILDMRGGKENEQLAMTRIKFLADNIDAYPVDDPLRLALVDLLNDDGATGKRFFFRSHVVEEISRLEDHELCRYLRYRYAYDVYPVIKKVSKYPPLVQIEPTSICNYRCVFCYQIDKRLSHKKFGHMGSMQLEFFKKLIDELEGNVEAISLASRGEPTINKSLSSMLNYMAGKFLATKVNTNAYLLDDSISHAILDSDLQTLVFSADAAEEALYSKLRVNGNLERVLRNVERFNEIKEKYYPSSRLITRVSGVRFDSEQSMEDMEAYWGHLVDQVMFVDYNPWENVYDADRKGIDEPCSDLWRRMFIWWDGKVAPCDVDYLTTLCNESIQEKTISEIWQGEMYRALRGKHLNKERQNLEPCSRCVVV
jgi:MoaA/NifB/PqqE/SkfB family radical SAM enzyme